MTTGGGAEAAAVCCFSVGVQPVMTAAELITALRIMNVRRSTPDGTSVETNSLSAEGRVAWPASLGFMLVLSWLKRPPRGTRVSCRRTRMDAVAAGLEVTAG